MWATTMAVVTGPLLPMALLVILTVLLGVYSPSPKVQDCAFGLFIEGTTDSVILERESDLSLCSLIYTIPGDN